MTDQEKRIKIAQACGYENVFAMGDHVVHQPKGCRGFVPVPDYLNDLNAMHKAEKTLSSTKNTIPEDAGFCSEWDSYIANLEWVVAATCDEDSIYAKALSATANQRAEAFLQTIDESPLKASV